MRATECRPRCMLVEEHGQLVGLLTLKDLLKRIIEIEHEEEEHEQRHSPYSELEDALEEVRLWLKRTFKHRGWFNTSGSSSSPIQLSSSSRPTSVIFDADEDDR